MTSDNTAKPDSLDHLPEGLLADLSLQVRQQDIEAAAAVDLDADGRYADGCLVLTERRLGCCTRSNGTWSVRWIHLKDLKEAKIVEGLGVQAMRLLADGKLVDQFRYTMRHSRAVAKLHRRLEWRLAGKEEAFEPPPSRPEEKKTRCEKCGRSIPPWTEFCPVCTSKRKVLGRLLDFVKPYKWRAITGFALAMAVTVMNLIRPWLTKPMLNEGLGLEKGRTADYGVLMFYVGIMIALTLAVAGGQAVRERLMAGLGSRMARDLRDKTYAHLHSLSLSFFSSKPTGSLIARITSDSDRVWDFVAFTLIELVISLLTLVGVGVALFLMDWKLACCVLVPVPLMFVMTLYFHRKMHGFFHRLFHRWSRMTAVVSDALPGVRVVKAFGQERHEVDRFAQANQAYYEGELTMISLWTVFSPVLALCSRIGFILVWVVGGYWAVQGRLDPGTLMAFVGFMWMFYEPIHMLSHMDRMFNKAATSVQRIFEVLDTAPAVFSKAGAHKPDDVGGRIEMQNVTFSYDGVRRVLKGLELVVEPGQMVGLAGPSGGGKTTTANLICRFYDVLDGRILIDGVDVRDYELETLRRMIGLVPQEPFLFHGTVAENIAYGHREASIEQILQAAKAANAHEFIVSFPDGYDTLVGDRGHTLSGGEPQRVSIARAILSSPRILILDEATSSVDTETERLIQQALDRLIADRTTIAIAHRLSTLRRADKLVILENGQKVEEGSHDELAAKPDGVYAKLLRIQQESATVIAVAR
jgi:ATP-binding cassette subfamily B protein